MFLARHSHTNTHTQTISIEAFFKNIDTRQHNIEQKKLKTNIQNMVKNKVKGQDTFRRRKSGRVLQEEVKLNSFTSVVKHIVFAQFDVKLTI